MNDKINMGQTEGNYSSVDKLNVDRKSDLLDLFLVFAANKKKVVGIPLAISVLVAGLTLLIDNTYVATTKILPPQNQSSTSALLGQLGAIGAISGGSSALKNPNDIYIGILNSRTIADNMVDRFKLLDVYEVKKRSDARGALSKLTFVTNGKDGMISVDVEDKDPKRAAEMANAYVDELKKLNVSLAITEASQRRMLFEKQLSQVKKNLADAEVDLKTAQEKSGVIQLTGQAEAVIKGAAEVKAQIAAKEIVLRTMQTFTTVNNPDYIRERESLLGLQVQLKKLEVGANVGNGDISLSTRSVPEAGLEYIRKVRNVKYYEAIFEVIAKQYEIAKIDEAKEGATIQVLDPAIEPDKKSGPRRGLLVLVAFMFSGFLTLAYLSLKEIYRQAYGKDKYKGRLDSLSNRLSWK